MRRKRHPGGALWEQSACVRARVHVCARACVHVRVCVCVEGKPKCSQSLPGPAQTCPGFGEARLGSGEGDSPQKYVNFLIS